MRLQLFATPDGKVPDRMMELENNRRATDALQMEILRGLQKGENITKLFLKAMEALAILTGNGTLKENSLKAIESTYAYAFNEPGSVEVEIEQIRDRIAKLEASRAVMPEDRLDRIDYAIKAHKQRLELLEKTSRKP